MTTQLKYLTILITVSLISILGLQGYFLYTDYQSKKVDFESDLNAMLEVTAKEMNEWRNKEIYQLHRKDLLDTTYVKLEYNPDREDGAELTIIDAKTGERELSIVISKDKVPKDSVLSLSYLVNRFFKPVYDKDDDMLWMITQSLDRVTHYLDTLPVDMELFQSKLTKRMGYRSITPNYKMDVIHKDSVFVINNADAIVSAPFRLDHQGQNQVVIVYFDKPFFNVLKRSYLLLFASLGVLILVAISFSFLMKTINRQRKLAQLKDDFIDGVTHELLTPIATMKIALETLNSTETQQDREKSKRYLEISAHELERISGIVHNVLHTSLHEQNEARFSFEEVDLDKVVCDLINYHSNRSEKEVEFIYEAGQRVTLKTDKQHISNIIHNLIDNAIKYNTSEPAVVSIDIDQRREEVNLTVTDNGPGITESHQHKIFDKFYRAIDSDAETVNGLGVGLYYVKNTLERLGGTVALAKSSIEGSSFIVSMKGRVS